MPYTLFAFIPSLLLTVLFTAWLLPVLRKRHVGQRILEVGPKWHLSKEGTPTMGGLAFLAAITLVGCVFCAVTGLTGNGVHGAVLVLAYALLNGLIGIVDDAAKLRKKQNEGLLPWQKLLLQTTFAAAFLALWRLFYGGSPLPLPFHSSVDLGIFYYPAALLFLLGSVNFVNLTDGIDGLAATVSLIAGAFYTVFALLRGDALLMLVAAALSGGALGFLFFNAHPAKIFMGDTGSLYLGGLLAGCAFLSQSPLTLLPAGLIFYAEGLSVILQVAIYKLRKKRLFRMAPLHHHFEKGGWSEWRIVGVFSLAAVLAAAAGLPILL